MKNKNLWIGITLALVLIAAVILFFILRKPTYTVTFSTDGTAILETQNIKENDFAEEPTDPTKEGYVFAGWYLNGERYDFNTEVTEDITLVARWTKVNAILYTIKFDTNGGNKIDNIEVEKNNIIGKLPTPTKKGYEFKGWYFGTKLVERSTIVTRDMTLVAKWEKELDTTKNTTTKKTTTKKTTTTTTTTTTTKPTTSTTTTTTKAPEDTTTSTTTTKKVDVITYDYIMETIMDGEIASAAGQVRLYLVKKVNGEVTEKVSGTCDIVTTDGKTINKAISVNGYSTNKWNIAEIKNIKIN